MFGVAFGLSAGYRAKGPVLTDQSGVDDLALEDSATVIIDDATADEQFQYPGAAREEDIVTVLGRAAARARSIYRRPTHSHA